MNKKYTLACLAIIFFLFSAWGLTNTWHFFYSDDANSYSIPTSKQMNPLEGYMYSISQLKIVAPTASITYADWLIDCENVNNPPEKYFFQFVETKKWAIWTKLLGGFISIDTSKQQAQIVLDDMTSILPPTKDINFGEAFRLYSDALPEIKTLILPYQEKHPQCVLRVAITPQTIVFSLSTNESSQGSIYDIEIERETGLILVIPKNE